MLIVIVLTLIVLSVIMLSVIMLSVIMLGVVSPICYCTERNATVKKFLLRCPEDLLHEDDGRDDVGDEAGEGDDALDHPLDPEGEDLDEVVAILSVLQILNQRPLL
jgi:hypothetical protein